MFGRVPRYAVAALVLVAGYSVTTLHDAFATYRANLALIDAVRATGVPRTSIGGGLEYNMETEILAEGYVPMFGIRLPDGSTSPDRGSVVQNGPCEDYFLLYSPVVHPLYSFSYEGSGCERAAEFAPLRFRTWLPPYNRMLEVIRPESLGPAAAGKVRK